MSRRLMRIADWLNHARPGPYCWSRGLCLYDSELTSVEDGHLKGKPTLRGSLRLARKARQLSRACWFCWYTPDHDHRCLERGSHQGAHVCCCAARTDDIWTSPEGMEWIYTPAWDQWTGWILHEPGVYYLSGEEFRHLYPPA